MKDHGIGSLQNYTTESEFVLFLTQKTPYA